MRLWSLHPQYLDTKGLVALWREALLAKHVLEGKTRGYKKHSQLDRFKQSVSPVEMINQYLAEVYIEASNRNYNFNKEKINWNFRPGKLTVTSGQFDYEKDHLLNKLQKRDPEKFLQLKIKKKIKPHPLFDLIKGEIEQWEILSSS